jgi:hypothetical protein
MRSFAHPQNINNNTFKIDFLIMDIMIRCLNHYKLS